MLKIYLLLVSLIFSLSLSGQVITLETDTRFPVTISEQLTTFVDTTSTLSLADVQKKHFQPVGRRNFQLPYSDATYWYRCTLRNNTPRPKTCYIEWDNPTVELVAGYFPGQDHRTYRMEKRGLLAPNSPKNLHGESPYFTFDMSPGESQTIYLRVRSQRGYRMNVNVYDTTAMIASQAAFASHFSFASGLVFLRLFFVLLLALFAVKERAFRAYCFLLVLRSLGFWGVVGALGSVLTDQPTLGVLINFLSYHLVPIGYVLVVNALLLPDRLPKLTRYILNGLVVAVLVLGAIIIFDYHWYWLLTSQYLVLFSQIFVFGLYIYAVARRLPINWYYSVPFLLGLGSYFLMVLGDVNIIDAEWVFAVAYLLFLAEIFVFALFLGKIILDYRHQREATQQQLILQEQQAIQLKELDTLKTNFFANISHEFRTPLTMLVGPLEDFRREQPANPLIPAMQRNVRRLKSLIDQILDLSRLEAGHLQPAIVRADLARFLRQLFASFESLAQSRSIIFNYQQNFNSQEAYFDPDKLEKIVTNLLSNAFKFTPENGRVWVRVSYTEVDVNLEIRDYGIGIEAERLPHIFDRFYRVESKGHYETEGAGIGLALVHELVRVLQGEIQVESQLGQGSTFTLKLPTDVLTWNKHLTGGSIPDLTPPLSERVHEPDLEAPAAPPLISDAPLLLIVEDNPDLRAYMQGIFRENYRIIEATDGQDGLDHAFAEIPDLAICDVMMPRLDGFGFCKKLKSDARTSHIPVVMLTARATLEDRLEGLELGADDYLIKPFNRTELELRVQNLLKQRDMLRQKYGQQIAETPKNGQKSALNTVDDRFLNNAIRMIEERMGDSTFSTEELSSILNMSRSNLHRKLKAVTGQSTTEFIRSIRIYRAAELLKQPGVTVSEVAYQVGFESASYFSRAFREQMGTSPSDWITSDNN
jgi:signal transduction histidine kinase/DNA-binding response OmpR family regulator